MAGNGENAVGGPARHIPVLLDEVLAALAPAAGDLVVDGTFGAGGYTRAILDGGAYVIAIDRDPDAIEAGRALERESGGRLRLVQAPFSELDAHVAAERRRGRMVHAEHAWLKTMAERARDFGVVGEDTKLQAGLSLAFLAACLVNVMGLLAARFANRAGEIGVRRALGASRRQVLVQFLVESGVVGLAGAALGLLLTLGGLALTGRRSEDLAAVARLDTPMLALALALSIGGALLAGLWPTWRASRVRPAMQLKSQ